MTIHEECFEHDLVRQSRLVANYIIEEIGIGNEVLINKGDRPALEALATEFGWAEEHHGNRILIRPVIKT